MNKSYQIIQNITHRNRRTQLGWGILVFLFGSLLAILLPTDIAETRRIPLQLLAFAAIIIGLYAIIHAIRIQNPDKNRILHSLKERPQNIVWIYSYITVNMPFGIQLFRTCTMYVNFVDGKQSDLKVDPNRYDEINQLLQDDLPHATFGYTVQREQLYRADPKLLYKD